MRTLLRKRFTALAVVAGVLCVVVLGLASGPAQPVAQAAPQEPVQAFEVQQTGNGCAYDWFFRTRTVDACPAAPYITTQAVLLQFERGYMVWFGSESNIYVLYRDWEAPYWEVYRDTWLQGTAERDPAITGVLGLWQQPRRGFGHLWRTNDEVRARLGWALYEWELDYGAFLQKTAGEDPAVFFTGPDNKVYYLPAGGGGWDMFSWMG